LPGCNRDASGGAQARQHENASSVGCGSRLPVGNGVRVRSVGGRLTCAGSSAQLLGHCRWRSREPR
jgi:hypothetical protein